MNLTLLKEEYEDLTSILDNTGMDIIGKILLARQMDLMLRVFSSSKSFGFNTFAGAGGAGSNGIVISVGSAGTNNTVISIGSTGGAGGAG